MHYELWDTETANLIGTYDTEEQALSVVLSVIHTRGRSAAGTLFLGVEHEDGASTPVAEGEALVERALTVAA